MNATKNLRDPHKKIRVEFERAPLKVRLKEKYLSILAHLTVVRNHHSKSHPDVSVHSRGTCFPCTALTFKPRIDSHHVCTWESPVGKPNGKASWERLEGKP